MSAKKNLVVAIIALSFLLSLSSITLAHPPKEYDAVVRHLKTQYKAKKVNLYVMWLARAAVSMIKPAGVKSFSLTVFEHLQFSSQTLDSEMQAAMRRSYGPEWSEIFHARSRTGEQAYMYMKSDDQNVKVVLVTIEKEQAAIIRATFSPDKLIEFINNPQILGIKLDDDKPTAEPAKSTEPKTTVPNTPEQK
jgi:hypothetical protein